MSNNAPVIDQADDINGQHLHHIRQQYGISDPFPDASTDARTGSGNLQTQIYGAPHFRKFACHTGPATFLSALYFLDQKENLDPVMAEAIWERIEKSAAYHGVEGLVKDAQHSIQEIKEKALDIPDEDYGLIWEENGIKKKAYPISSLEELTKAAEYFYSNRRDFPYAERRSFARKILEKSAAYSVEPAHYDEICKSAGAASGSAQNAVDVLFQRAKELALSSETAHESLVLAKAAEAIHKDPTTAHSPRVLSKLASILDGINRKTFSIHKRELPEDQLFTITQKTAEDNLAGRVLLSNGAVFNLRALAENVPLYKIADVMGEPFTDSISVGGAWLDVDAMADILPGLNKQDAQLFTKAAETAEVPPERYSEGRLRFTPEVLRELAAI